MLTSPTPSSVYASRVSWWLFGPILALPVVPLLLLLIRGISAANLLVLVVLSASSAYLFYLIQTTAYTLTPDHLLIRCGPQRLQIPLSSIRSVGPSRNLVSSPALAVHGRLEVHYGRFGSVLISPANSSDFLATLRHLNPAISYARAS
mgnify:CR=1 FL=1